MKYYKLTCESPGGIGGETIYNKKTIPWVVKQLHVPFEVWLGAEICTIESCVIVTAHLAKALGFEFTGIKGYEYFYLEVPQNFKIRQPDTQLPKFKRMLIGNKAFEEDFAFAFYNGLYNQLIISEKARLFLEEFNLGNYSIELAVRPDG